MPGLIAAQSSVVIGACEKDEGAAGGVNADCAICDPGGQKPRPCETGRLHRPDAASDCLGFALSARWFSVPEKPQGYDCALGYKSWAAIILLRLRLACDDLRACR